MTDTDPNPNDYHPISCARYSEYERAILHRRELRLRWRENNVIHDETVLPLDLRTQNHQEFLVCRSHSGAVLTLRLDHIRHVEFR